MTPQVVALRWLVRQRLRDPAEAFRAHRLTLDLKAQGLGVARDAVHEMLGHLMDAFLLAAVPIRATVGYVGAGAGFEVDFLASGATGSEELIRVCADPLAPETKERELRALVEALGGTLQSRPEPASNID